MLTFQFCLRIYYVVAAGPAQRALNINLNTITVCHLTAAPAAVTIPIPKRPTYETGFRFTMYYIALSSSESPASKCKAGEATKN